MIPEHEMRRLDRSHVYAKTDFECMQAKRWLGRNARGKRNAAIRREELEVRIAQFNEIEARIEAEGQKWTWMVGGSDVGPDKAKARPAAWAEVWKHACPNCGAFMGFTRKIGDDVRCPRGWYKGLPKEGSKPGHQVKWRRRAKFNSGIGSDGKPYEGNFQCRQLSYTRDLDMFCERAAKVGEPVREYQDVVAAEVDYTDPLVRGWCGIDEVWRWMNSKVLRSRTNLVQNRGWTQVNAQKVRMRWAFHPSELEENGGQEHWLASQLMRHKSSQIRWTPKVDTAHFVLYTRFLSDVRPDFPPGKWGKYGQLMLVLLDWEQPDPDERDLKAEFRFRQSSVLKRSTQERKVSHDEEADEEAKH